MEVRPERPGEQAAVLAVVAAAFGRDDEARLVERVRAAGLERLSLVAEARGAVAGHVALCDVELTGPDGTRPLLQLVPLSVAPAHQGRGIGSALTRAALAWADETGAPVVLVEGSPTFYRHFGFEEAAALDIEPPPGVPSWAFQAARLRAWSPLRGRVAYPPALAGPAPETP